MTNIFDKMLQQAKDMLNKAYAPYSKFQVGACIRCDDTTFFTGCNIENASYGLSLCAEAVAIAHMVKAGYTEISEMLIISSGNLPCTPCGACRQRIREFADKHTQIHCCNPDGEKISLTIDELLPKSFGPHHLTLETTS